MPRYMILDIESSGKTTYRRFSNPLDPNHQVDLFGYHIQNDSYRHQLLEPNKDWFKDIDLSKISTIVGHNLKFDLLWLWGNKKLQEWVKNGGKVWDTLTVQYLIDGQRRIPRSLDDLSLRYGGTLKASAMKEYYKAGGLSKDVPIEELIQYNKEDVENTNLILQRQVNIVKEKNLQRLVNVYMEHYLAIIEMEYNGLHLNSEGLVKKLSELNNDKEGLYKKIIQYAEQNKYPNFNPLSLDHLSLFLFGGSQKVRQKMPQFLEDGTPCLIKKTGLQKEKYETLSIESKGIIPIFDWLRKNKKGYYFLTNTELGRLSESKLLNNSAISFINDILNYRKLTKKTSTYYEGLLECQSEYTNCVHPEFKTAFTDTGRLSSVNPNAQNLLPEVVEYIDSRYGKDGQLIEIDASQLEVRLQAYITDCHEMMNDIEKGIDFHVLRLSYAEGMEYDEVLKLVHSDHEWALKRKNAKTISFQKAYGASPVHIAEETGLSEDVVNGIFYQEDLRYPEIKEFYENISQSLPKNRIVTGFQQKIKDKITGLDTTVPGEQAAYAMYKSITGKEYYFDERAVLTKRGHVFRYFNMPKIQNSPVQGTAADFISCQVGQFYRWLIKSGLKCRLINEIHDAILLDCHKECLTTIIDNAKLILSDTTKFETLTNRKFQIEMPFDVKYGSTWLELKEKGE